MLTDGQRRALRARQLLDRGIDAREVARELGYTKVSGMLGSIALCEARLERDRKDMEAAVKTQEKAASKVKQTEEAKHDAAPAAKREELPKTSPVAHLYPVENGMVTIRKDHVSVTWKPVVGTLFINIHAYKGPKWLPLYGNLLGGREGIARALRQIAEAATEAAALLEEEEHVDHHAR